MPPSKKQKIDTGSPITTLHHFFNGNGRRTKNPGVSRRVKTDAEIIVIDSDDDEVEIIDGPNDSSSRGLTACRKFVQECPVQLEQPNTSKNVSSPGSVKDVTFLSFGVPTLLQPQKPIFETNHAAENFTTRGVRANIGDETLEIAQTVASRQNDELSFIYSPRIFPSDLAIGMDDWGTGDDEMNLVSARDDDDEYAEDNVGALELPTNYTELDKIRPETAAINSKNAYSVLMSSLKESDSWQEASKMEDRSIRPTKSNRRKAPFYKVLQGMPIAVDAFRYGKIPSVTAYFLTHAHADHYTNLSSSWKNGPIYCSEGTANLIIHMLSVDKKWVHPLPMDVPTIIPDSGDVRVTLIEANHCPGSCLFFFEGPQTVDAGDSTYKSPHVGTSRIFRYLHCGDFRASPRHVLHPAVKGKRIDHVYLDTTYLDPKYTFPPQPLIISACAELAKRISEGASLANKSGVEAWVIKNSTKQSKAVDDIRTLFVVGTYSVGKERILKAIAHALQSKVYCDSRKTALLRCQADDELNDLLISDPLLANVHVLPLAMITSDRLKTYLEKFQGQFDNVVGFRPTGWTYAQAAGAHQMPSIAAVLSQAPHREYSYLDLQPSRQSTRTLQIYPVPYSEHSSFFELTCFAMSFGWVRMIATVNVGSESSRRKMAGWVSRWEAERKKRGCDTVVPYRHPDYW